MTFLSPKGQIRTVANQGREGMQRREKQPRNNSAGLGEGPGSALRDTHNNIFELFYRTKTPNKQKMLAFFIPEKTTWGQIKGTREAHQEITWDQIKGVQALHTP